MTMIEWLTRLFSTVQDHVFESAVQPLVYAIGLGGWMEDAFDATGWLLVGLIEVALLVALIGPLQRWRPVEPVADRAAVRTDIVYTLIHRLGLFRLAMFFLLRPVFDAGLGLLRSHGLGSLQLDALWPGVTDHAWVALLIYLVVLDFVDYWVHRGQHQFNWWWSLHSLHHAQRQMTMWSDNRNHLLDDVLRDAIVVGVAQLIGVAPGQFIAIIAFTQLSQSLQHANLRLDFGRIGERLWVSPRFHRLHHSIGIGHESPIRPRTRAAGPPQGAEAPSGGSAAHEVASVGAHLSAAGPPQGAEAPSGGSAASVGARLGGHNFGVLLPWWDMLFRSARFDDRYDPTGVRDQVEPDAEGRLRDYGKGFWSQQWLGLKRLAGRA